MDELTLFAAAIAVADPVERSALLDLECAGRPDQRARIERLIEVHFQSNEFLDVPNDALAATAAHRFIDEGEGAVIAGRYKLLEAIGEGGMGAVWVAEQTEPVRRKVAVKLIKAGMDSKSVLARFDAERQALAVMDHPNIAKVLDGGLTDAGRPFFVMEYVKGVPITEYCDEKRLSVSDRLSLFVQVCNAVQHAHQKGIIHRDLKPSNILVAPYDDQPVPKVIDFGLAKAMHQSLTDRTLHTAHETVLGTPLYMSPEQAQLNNLDVDTRSDVYSLGVLLYELLTGTTPLEKKRFKEAAWDEIKRIIREEEPPRPSARLSSTDTLPSLAASRHTEPVKLTKLVRGELDWIVMKALEKDRSRRYETANGFAMDLQRYLNGDPVLAAPAGTGYRLKKFVWRNRTALATTMVIALLLVGGVTVSTWQAVRATRSERESEKAKKDAIAAAEAEKKAHSQAQRRLTQLEKGNEVLTAVFKDLDVGRVRESNEPLEAVLAKRLIKAAEQLEGEALGEPLVVAGLQFRLAMSLVNLGQPKAAIPLLIKARATRTLHLGAEHRDTLNAMAELAEAHNASGERQFGGPLQMEALKLRKATLGPDHLDTLETMNNVAVRHLDARRPDLAVPLLEECLRVRKAKQDADLMGTLAVMGNLASAYGAVGKLDLAIQMTEENLRLSKTTLEPDHPHVFHAMNNLAILFNRAGRSDDAVRLHEETLRVKRKRLGADHPETLKSMNNLTLCHLSRGRADLALPVIQEAAALVEKRQFQYEGSARILGSLMTCYERLNQLDQAEASRRKWTAVVKDRSGADSPAYGTELAALGLYLLQQKKWTEAETVFRECLALREKAQPNLWTTFNTHALLGGALLGQKKYSEAEPLLLKGHDGMKKREKTIAPHSYVRFIEAHERLVELYKATNKPDEAKKWQAELAGAVKRKPTEKK